MTTEVQGRIATPVEHTAWWRDERKRGIVAQVVTILIVVGVFWFLIYNMLENQKRLGLSGHTGQLVDADGRLHAEAGGGVAHPQLCQPARQPFVDQPAGLSRPAGVAVIDPQVCEAA